MKKKIIAVVLAALMMLATLPGVMAEDGSTYIGRYASYDLGGQTDAIVAFYMEDLTTAWNFMVVEEFGNEFTIVKEHVLNGDSWYELDTSSWPETFVNNTEKSPRNYKFVKKTDKWILGGSVDTDVRVEESVGDVTVSVSGDIPEGTKLTLADAVETVVAALADFGIEDAEDILGAFDIKPMLNDEVWQPAEGNKVKVTLDAIAMGLADGDIVTILHKHEDKDVESLGEYTVADGKITFDASQFSIYVVTIDSNNWNRNNYAIYMTLGDTVKVASTNNNGTWSVEDSSIISLSQTNVNQPTITANKIGRTTLKRGNQSIEVTVVEAVGNDISDDIIFKNITVPYSGSSETQIDEYNNTYGPYVMKIRFEDSAGNLITVDRDYYVFDSAVDININTFAVTAPAGYTYDGAYFFWNGHTGDNADRIYITEVVRKSALGSGGSYLYFDHGTTNDDWYQSSGVLHIVYRKTDEAYNIRFLDHEDTLLHSFAPKKADGGVYIPSDYVATLDVTLSSAIESNHDEKAPGYVHTGYWIVNGNGMSNVRYTTAQLKNAIPTWRIRDDITIKAECEEEKVTLHYKAVAVGTGTGTVSPAEESLDAVTGVPNGSTATADAGSEFAGWYADEACTQLITTNAKLVPTKGEGEVWVDGTTYYAKFDKVLADLTIRKVAGENTAFKADDNFIFTIKGGDVDMTVVINGEDLLKNKNSVTIKDLPIAEYTVTEDTNWSWRYTADSASETVNVTADGGSVTFTNTIKTDKWLSGESSAENQFTVNDTAQNN